jgi:hypothetical protein
LLETLENLRDRIDILSDQANRIQERQLNQSSYVWLFVKVCGRRMLLQVEHRRTRSQNRVAIPGEVSYDPAV